MLTIREERSAQARQGHIYSEETTAWGEWGGLPRISPPARPSSLSERTSRSWQSICVRSRAGRRRLFDKRSGKQKIRHLEHVNGVENGDVSMDEAGRKIRQGKKVIDPIRAVTFLPSHCKLYTALLTAFLRI